MADGIVLFNFGQGCVLRLMVCLYTLRKNYKQNVILQLATEDDGETNDRISQICNRININIQKYDLTRICNRNVKSIVTPQSLKISPYNTSIHADSDTVFRHSPEELILSCKQEGVLVSNFCNWVSSGGIMRRRIRGISKLISKDQLRESLAGKTAINSGIVGYTKGTHGDQFQKEWEELTLKGAGQFIIEEVACQCTYWKYKHYMAPIEWNASCVFGDFKKAKMIHYHGGKHGNLSRASCRYWLAELGWGIEDGIYSAADVMYWVQFDKSLRKNFGITHIKNMENAKKEFASIRKSYE